MICSGIRHDSVAIGVPRIRCMMALQDFLAMIPQSYSLHDSDPFTAFMKGKTVCSEDGDALRRWAAAHKFADQVERTGEVCWVRKRRRETELWLRRN
jgi:hypothetical protein